MTVKRVLAAAVGGVLFAAAGVAAAGNFASDRQVDYFSRGTHQFFVWCGKGNDYLTTAEGTNAEDAQMRLYGDIKKDGKLPCWPVWQGRISAKAN
jgi:hypothetical protein